MPKIKKKKKSSNVLKFSCSETLKRPLRPGSDAELFMSRTKSRSSWPNLNRIKADQAYLDRLN